MKTFSSSAHHHHHTRASQAADQHPWDKKDKHRWKSSSLNFIIFFESSRMSFATAATSVGGCFWLFGDRGKVATASFQPSISDSEGSLTWRICTDMEMLVSKPYIVSFIALIWERWSLQMVVSKPLVACGSSPSNALHLHQLSPQIHLEHWSLA